MGVIGRTYVSGTVLVLALVLIVFAYGSTAQAQTPADDQYGSPAEIGVPADAVGAQSTDAPGAPGSGTGMVGTSASGVPSSGEASGGVLTSALPATGGSLFSLTALVGLALIGTGLLVFRKRSARS